MLKAFLKDSIIYTIPTLVSRGLALFLVPLYTRVLSPSDYGSLDLLIVFASIINLTITLEVSQGVARYYTSEKNTHRKLTYASSALWFTVVCYTVFATLMLIFTNSLAPLIMGQSDLESIFQIGIVYIWINALFYLIQNQFRWELRSKNYAVVSLLMSVVTAGFSIWLTYRLHWGLKGLLIGMVIGSLSGTILGWWWLRNSFRFYFDTTMLREMLTFSAPLVFSGVAIWISLYIDRIMINHFLSIDEVGLYSVGYRIASVAGLIMVGFQGALTPLIYTHDHKAETPQHLARIFRFFMLFALLMFLGLSLFAIDISHLLTTELFYDSAIVVIYLVPAILLSNMYIFTPGIGIAKKTHYLIWINITGALLNIVLNYFLIPPLGIKGAGIATLLSYLVTFIILVIVSQRLYNIPHHWRPIIISTLTAALLAWYLPQFQITATSLRWGFNLLTLAMFILIALALNLIHTNELHKGIAMFKTHLLSRPPKHNF